MLAAAAGTVLQTHDGEFDRNTVNGVGGFGNYVFMEHGAGDPLAYYGHMRKGSIRVSPGAAIKRGDTLGLVGSSGNSSWPHLHFEVSDAGQVVDPFIGPCNQAASQPSWLDQLPWQGEFAVLDAGISRRPLSWAEILERPTDDAVIVPADKQVSFWATLYNIQVPSTRTVLLNPAGAVLAEISTADARTFSAVFLLATFNIVGIVTTAGQYAITLSVTTPAGSSLEVARRHFTYDPGAVPSAERAPSLSGVMRHTVRISPSAGDRP